MHHAPYNMHHTTCTMHHAPCYPIPRSHGPHTAPMRRKRAMPCSRASGPSSQQFEGWLSSCMHTRAGGSVGAPWATERASSGERSRRTSKPLPAPPRPALTTAEIVNCGLRCHPTLRWSPPACASVHPSCTTSCSSHRVCARAHAPAHAPSGRSTLLARVQQAGGD